MTLRLGESAGFRLRGEELQEYRYWKPEGYSRKGTVLLLPGAPSGTVEAANHFATSGEWIFAPEAPGDDPIQVRDLSNLIRRFEFRYDLHVEDLTLVAAGPHALPALTWVAITQPMLRALVLVEPNFEFRDQASQEVVQRLVEAAPLLDLPVQILLGDSRKVLGKGPVRRLFEQLGTTAKKLATVPPGSAPWLAGVSPERCVRQIQEFTRGLERLERVEVA